MAAALGGGARGAMVPRPPATPNGVDCGPCPGSAAAAAVAASSDAEDRRGLLAAHSQEGPAAHLPHGHPEEVVLLLGHLGQRTAQARICPVVVIAATEPMVQRRAAACATARGRPWQGGLARAPTQVAPWSKAPDVAVLELASVRDLHGTIGRAGAASDLLGIVWGV